MSFRFFFCGFANLKSEAAQENFSPLFLPLRHHHATAQEGYSRIERADVFVVDDIDNTVSVQQTLDQSQFADISRLAQRHELCGSGTGTLLHHRPPPAVLFTAPDSPGLFGPGVQVKDSARFIAIIPDGYYTQQ
jgi:hypothetical protein